MGFVYVNTSQITVVDDSSEEIQKGLMASKRESDDKELILKVLNKLKSKKSEDCNVQHPSKAAASIGPDVSTVVFMSMVLP